MKHILLTTPAIDWGNLGEAGLITLVITAVFVIIVKPLVQQLVDNNANLTIAITSLNKTISQGDAKIVASVKSVEHSIELIVKDKNISESRVMEKLANIQSQLERLESQL